ATPKTYMPPAISLLARSAAPAIALYQLRLNRRNGNTAVKVFESTRFIRMPDRNAIGNQIKEQTRCQKRFLALRRLTHASMRSIRFGFACRPARTIDLVCGWHRAAFAFTSTGASGFTDRTGSGRAATAVTVSSWVVSAEGVITSGLAIRIGRS